MSNRTKRLKALGNSVVPQCAQWIGERILEHWYKSSYKSAQAEETKESER